MLGDNDLPLSERELTDVATTVVLECESAFAALADSLEGRLCAYSPNLRYRALAIGLIYILANHLRRHAALTSTEESVELAARHLRKHMAAATSRERKPSH